MNRSLTKDTGDIERSRQEEDMLSQTKRVKVEREEKKKMRFCNFDEVAIKSRIKIRNAMMLLLVMPNRVRGRMLTGQPLFFLFYLIPFSFQEK